MTGVETVTVRAEDGAGRLDRWFKRHYPGLSHGKLEKLLRTGQIPVDGKRARAVVVGLPELRQGRIDLGLAKRGGAGRERVHADDEEGKSAITYYRVVDHAGAKASWLALLPVTGRTHQLRAHCAALGTPILGDGKYGGTGAQLAGGAAAQQLHLHARSLEIPRPNGGTLRVTAPLPPHMKEMTGFFGFA